MKQVLNLGSVALVGYLLFSVLPLQAATIFVNCPGQSLQPAVDAAQPGDEIRVSGTCNENILVRNEKQRVTIRGGLFGGEVHGPDTSLPTITIRGKGISINALTITGGKSGVHVNRGSNAVIDGNGITTDLFLGGAGIQVDQQSFAVITNSTISGYDFGVFVDGSSTVRIGYNQDTDLVASPNTITGNGVAILIQGSSDATIAGNTISSNNEGIFVRQQSHAIISGNNIGNNSFDAIRVVLNSGVDLASGRILGPSFLDTVNNSNAGDNGVVSAFGVSCAFGGGYVSGHIGTLSGVSGVKNIVAPCQDLLN